jgi:hypothetical protein
MTDATVASVTAAPLNLITLGQGSYVRQLSQPGAGVAYVARVDLTNPAMPWAVVQRPGSIPIVITDDVALAGSTPQTASPSSDWAVVDINPAITWKAVHIGQWVLLAPSNAPVSGLPGATVDPADPLIHITATERA